MKFLVTKDTQATGLLRFLMGGLLAAVLLYLPMDAALHGLQLGFAPANVGATLYGNEEAFIEPILLDALLLQVHIDLFMTLFVVLILSLPKKLLLLGAYLFGTVVLYSWIGVFVFWHLFAFGLSIVLLKKVVR